MEATGAGCPASAEDCDLSKSLRCDSTISSQMSKASSF